MQIKELKIYTARLLEQTKFYADVLKLEINNQTENAVSFIIGKSMLTIEYRHDFRPYHFAINIPSNQEIEALRWIRTKVKVLKYGNKEVQNFDAWNARAIYFYDSDKNIVELIARRNLGSSSEKSFDHNSLLEISEIGMPSNEIEREFKALNEGAGLKIYSGGFEEFCAIGDESGLIICVRKNGRNWFPTNDRAYSADFSIVIDEKSKKYKIDYKDGKLSLEKGH